MGGNRCDKLNLEVFRPTLALCVTRAVAVWGDVRQRQVLLQRRSSLFFVQPSSRRPGIQSSLPSVFLYLSGRDHVDPFRSLLCLSTIHTPQRKDMAPAESGAVGVQQLRLIPPQATRKFRVRV